MGQVIEQLKKLWAGLKEFWAKQSKKNKILIIVGLVVLVALIALLVVWMNQTKYTILYSGLDADERVEVEEYLNSAGVAYKTEGDTLYVDELSEESVRMELSNLGHPYSTPSYDFYFENVGTLTTSEERALIEEYQLNQRLADVIKTIDGVESATVTIAYPQTSSYVLSESEGEVTAGVTVTLGAGVTLNQTQVNGIVTLVSTSVPGLTAENVSVLNTATGETLMATDSGGNTVASADAYALKLDVENLYEQEIQNKVLSVLQPIYGANNVRVSVKSSIDINDSVKEIMTYFPSEDNKGVISSEDLAYAIQNEGGSVSGVTGTDSNAELPESDDASSTVTENEDLTTYPSVTVDGDTIFLQDEKSYDYLVSYVKEQVKKTAGEVEGLTVSVILNRETISDSKRQELTNLIANAAAIEDEHVVVYTDLFDTSGQTIVDNIVSPFEEYPWLVYVIIIGAAFLIILIAVIVVLTSRKKRKKKAEEEAAAAAAAVESAEQGELSLDASQMEELQDIKIAKGLVMKQKIQDFSKENPEIAAQLVKSWLRGEDN